MGNWFCDKKSVENRGLIFGLWTCHQYMGDITAALCTAVVLGEILLVAFQSIQHVFFLTISICKALECLIGGHCSFHRSATAAGHF